MASEPLAYFLTFRTYATWLHGDTRGSTSNRRNAPGDPPIEPDARLEAAERRSSGEGVTLDEASRGCVLEAIFETASVRGWTLHAANVRTNHVHLVVTGTEKPERMLVTFKVWATKRLRRENLAGPEARVWSRHGSTRYLWSERDVAAACAYVLDGQDGKGS